MRGDVQLRPLDAALLSALLEAAVADADPEEVMPPVPGPPGWTDARREAFLRFHRGRAQGLAADPVEATYAVLLTGPDGEASGGRRVVGAARLCPVPSGDGEAEAGLWLGRSVRRTGVGGAAFRLLVEEARAAGRSGVVAATTPDNQGARRLLAALGARTAVTAEAVEAHLSLLPADGPG
ncbi:GNAT family N-acetyltransferase [Streptomyces chumphonensis]|uniref:GNAT family N-acetyltransferase n=1 Tax=Streptomyces chumphonensis TaxID=1214925 RepID=A0A927F3K2_9ACTN|nr:GNAT family N-acetyltransferase [Streptomyces chumphonensis]MBD3934899.1 GNAT family N-acetyltransferase [Streptomyces chumphonensis]